MTGSYSQFSPNVEYENVVIANGESITAALNLDGKTLVGIRVPEGTDGSYLTFQGSYDGVNFDDYEYDDTEFQVAMDASSAGKVMGLSVQKTAPMGVSIKIRTGTSASPTNQTGGVTLQVATLRL